MAINPSDWGRRVEITVSGSVSSLAGYVGLITESNLPSEIWTRALNGGGDLRACLNSDGTNQLPLEISLFDTTAQDAILWTRFPIFATGSSVWLFYDKAGETQPPVTDLFGRNAVWADQYAVFHLNEAANNTVGGYADSAGNTSATGVSMSLPNVPGPVGVAANFDGANDRINAPVTLANTEILISAWAKVDSLTRDNRLASLVGPTGGGPVVWMDTGGAGDGWAAVDGEGGSNIGENNSDATLDWQYIALYVNPSNALSVYVDGVLTANRTANAIDLTNYDTLQIGRIWGLESYFDGAISHLKLAQVDRRNHLPIEYANQSDPATFWTTGTPEDTGGSGAKYTITLDLGSYSATGQDVALLSNKLISLESGAYTYDGQNVDLFAGRSINLESGNYAYNGQDVNLLANKSISLESGNYTYTGQDVTLAYNPSGGPTYLLTIDAGAYNYSGQDTQLIANRTLSIDSGAYAYTGSDLSLRANRSISIDSGAYVVTGNAVTLSANRAITLDAGNYAYTGSPVTLSYSGEVIALISGYSVNYAQDAATATYTDDYINARFI